MKKLFHQPRLILNQVKFISLIGFLFLGYSTTSNGQSLTQFLGQNQFDSKSNYPLIFLHPEIVTQQAATSVWESIQTFVIEQPANNVGQNTFAKPVSLNLDQVRNGSADAPVSSTTSAPWVNGNAGESNAHYVEGYSIPYRLVIENLIGNGARSVDIEWDTRQSNASAIDFITNYDMIDYPAGSHVFNFTHPKELIGPVPEAGTWVENIPANNIVAPTLPAAALNTFNAIQTAGLGKFGVWNATITGMTYLNQDSYTGQSGSTRVRIFFTNSAPDVIISWGGHIARAADWGPNNSASAVSGSPYHTRLIEWDPDGAGTGAPVSVGNQDRSLSAAAVLDPPKCTLDGPTSMDCRSTSTFTSGVTSSDLSAGVTYEWSFPVGSDNASFCGTAVDYACVTATKTNCGAGKEFTVRYRLLKNGVEISRCNWEVDVTDNTPPVISGVGGPSTIECPATPTFSSPTASDACSGTTVAIPFTDETVTSCGNARTVTRKWTATDGCNNTATASQTITVRDNVAPVISGVGGPSTIDCPASPSFSSPTASDACSNSTATITFSDATTTSCGNARTVTRKWLATDACGNTATASQAITVRDNVGPVITGVGGPSTIDCPAEPSFSSPTASDACTNSTASISFSDATTNSCGAARSVTRKWTATDACGNTTTASQTITVRDNTPPVITCPANVVVECDVNIATAALGTATATDACGSSTVSSSDGPPTVRGCVTVVNRKWVARDACGNTSSCVQIITKRDNTGPVINCTNGTATDNCSPAGDITIYLSGGIWTAIDGSGNITTATANCSEQGAGRLSTSQVTEETKEQQVVVEEKTAAPIARKELVNNITVQTIPNPFNDRVKFVVTSPEAGYGSLEVMNMLGQKVKTVFQGQMNTGSQSFEMVLPQSRYATLFYILRINGKQVTGKLVQAGNRN